MSTVPVGFLGGPHDGRVQSFPAMPATGMPSPVLEAAEPTVSPEEYRRTIIDGEPTAIPTPMFRTVAYRLMVNRGNVGPRLYYVHPTVRLPADH